MFGNLSYKSSRVGVVDPGDIVHTPDDEVDTIRRPSQIVYLSSARAAHMFRSPCFLVVLCVAAEARRRYITRNPQDHVAIVTGRGKSFAFRRPTNHVNGLVVFG